jgi:hypothetical protein
MRFSFTFLLFILSIHLARSQYDPYTGLWPKPQHANIGSTQYTLDPTKFVFNAAGHQSKILDEAFARYKHLVFYAHTGSSTNKAGMFHQPLATKPIRYLVAPDHNPT